MRHHAPYIPMLPEQIEPQRGDVEVVRASIFVIVDRAKQIIDLLLVVVVQPDPLHRVDELHLLYQVGGGNGF